MSETEKLLPCPFCGQPPETRESGVDGTGLMIFCISDDCPNPHTSYYSHAATRRVWNRRATPKAEG